MALQPKSKKPRTIHVNAPGADQFLRKNLVSEDTSYEIEQFVIGINDDGEPAIVPNPAYDGRLDPNGKLKELEMSDREKIGTNGQHLKARYPVEFDGLDNTKPKRKLIRQDN